MTSMILNSAHPPGNTCLAFSHDGSKLYTGGSEGLVRIWRSDLGSQQEPDVAHEAEDAITSLATSRKCWLSASHDACVRTYDAHGLVMEGFVTRAIAVPVRSVSIDSKGERVAVASDELEVKIISLSDITNIRKLEGHRKGVRRATWDPSGVFLTTCGSDGDIIVWDVSPETEPKRIETISGIIPAVDSESSDYAHDCSAVWHPSGKYFIVASLAHELVVISRDAWKKTATFYDDDIAGAITALALSPNGMYLASASKAGIFIWSTATRNILFRHRHDPTPVMSPLVSHMAFSPMQNLLAWTGAEGTLTRWPHPIPSTSPDPIKTHPAASNVGVSLKKKDDPMYFGEQSEEGKVDQPLMDTAGDDDYGLDDEDWMIDDIGLLHKHEKEPVRVDGGFAKEMVSVTKAQQPFQPASTPMVNKKRYLAYNMIGVIEVTDQDTHHIVNIEFHDRSTRSGSHFQDMSKCDLASLGERGALYACPPEHDQLSQIMYKPYSGWASSGEWHISLPQEETVIALAAGGTPPSKSLRNQSAEGDLEGNGNVVVATNRGYLRFFTGGGVQRYLWTLGADVVSMVAGCEWVFVVHRDGGTSLDGCQNLAYTLMALDTFDIVQHGRLPLPRGSILKWIGISEEGAPAMYDSNGLLSILDRFRRPIQGRWTPILDTSTLARRQGKDESYWPVGVSGTFFMCIILKGRETHPGFPRPLIQELEIQMPLFNLDASQGQMEERYLREELQIGILRDALGSDITSQEISQREIKLDKELIQLIQLACKSDKLQRALDTAALLHHTQSFDMAIKVAQFYHLAGLQEKLMALRVERAEVDRLEEEKEQRTRWGRHSLPIAAPRSNAQGFQNRLQIEEFAPPVTIRKSLAPAIPITNNRRTSRSTGGSADGLNPNDICVGLSMESLEPSTLDDSFEAETFISLTNDGKRKREESIVAEVDALEAGSATKKRVLPEVSTSDVTGNKIVKSANPFARKLQDTKSNPFSRPVASKANIATKSHSFFDKVDEANDIATRAKVIPVKTNGKEREKKDASRQTTLFGLLPGPGPEKRARTKLKDNRDGSDVASTPALSVQMDNEPTMEQSDMMDMRLVNDRSGGGDQPLSNVQEAGQTVNSPSNIEWPPSPPRLHGNSPSVTVNN